MGIRIQVENFGDMNRSIRYSLVEKKYTYALHMHQFTEVFILLEGELEITVDGKSELLSPGEGALILPFQSHQYYSKVNNKAVIFLFSRAIMPDFCKTVQGKIPDRSSFKLDERTLDALHRKIVNSENISIYDLKGTVYYILGDFLRQRTLSSVNAKTSLPAGIMNYIIGNLSEKINLTDLAKSLGYTPHYLSGVINDIFNMNFSKVVACVRVDKARRMLRESDKSRAEVCYECGFGSERSFHRQFKEITNLTPEEYRSRILGKPVQEMLFVEPDED